MHRIREDALVIREDAIAPVALMGIGINDENSTIQLSRLQVSNRDGDVVEHNSRVRDSEMRGACLPQIAANPSSSAAHMASTVPAASRRRQVVSLTQVIRVEPDRRDSSPVCGCWSNKSLCELVRVEGQEQVAPE